MSEDRQKCTIVVFSGDMDKVFAAFIIATTAAALRGSTLAVSGAGCSRR
jgi:peroxiredoxin family protein